MVSVEERIDQINRSPNLDERIPQPTSPSGASFRELQLQRNQKIMEVRARLIKEGFSPEEVSSALPLDTRAPQPLSSVRGVRARQTREKQQERARNIAEAQKAKAFTTSDGATFTSKADADAHQERIETPTTRTEIAESLFERQGKQFSKEGDTLVRIEGDKQFITTPQGTLVTQGRISGDDLAFHPEFRDKIGSGKKKTIKEIEREAELSEREQLFTKLGFNVDQEGDTLVATKLFDDSIIGPIRPEQIIIKGNTGIISIVGTEPHSKDFIGPVQQRRITTSEDTLLRTVGPISHGPAEVTPSLVGELGTAEPKTGSDLFFHKTSEALLTVGGKFGEFQEKAREKIADATTRKVLPEITKEGATQFVNLVTSGATEAAKQIFPTELISKTAKFNAGVIPGSIPSREFLQEAKGQAAGAIFKVAQTVREDPVLTTTLFVGGAVAGGLRVVLPAASRRIFTATLVAGTGVFAVGTGVALSQTETAFERGEIFGGAALDIGLIGKGFKSGEKAIRRLAPTIKLKAEKALRLVAEREITNIGETFSGIREVKQDVFALEVSKALGKTKVRKSELALSRTRAEIAEPTFTSIVGKDTFGIITPKGTQFSTTKVTLGGKDFFVRSTTDKGQTTTKVFLEDTLVKTVTGKTDPLIKFTEGVEQKPKKHTEQGKSTLLELEDVVSVSKGVQAGTRQVRGTRITEQRKRFFAEATGKEEISIFEIDTTGQKLPKLRDIELLDPEIKFTDSPVKPEPFLKDLGKIGKDSTATLTVSKPGTITSVQRSRFSSEFFITTKAPRAKEPQPKAPKVKNLVDVALRRNIRKAKRDEFVEGARATGEKALVVLKEAKKKTVGKIRQVKRLLPEFKQKDLTISSVIPKVSSAGKGKSSIRVFSGLDEDIKTRSTSKIRVGVAQPGAVDTFSISDIGFDGKIRPVIRIRSGTKPKQDTSASQDVISESVTRTTGTFKIPVPAPRPPGQIPSIIDPVIEKPGVPGLPKLPDKKKKPVNNKGYNVKVKKGNRFVTIAKNLPRNKALRKGRHATDNYIQDSFILTKGKRKPKVADDLTEPDLSKYRKPKSKSKLPRETFVEKRKHRLDTFTERSQLSYFKRKAARRLF